MGTDNIGEEDVFKFLLNEIDTVPHLEALLLIWANRPAKWNERQLKERLFIDHEKVRSIVSDLAGRGLIVAGQENPNYYWYESASPEKDRLLEAVERTYRRDLVRVSTLLHSKKLSPAQEFARAFKFTKD